MKLFGTDGIRGRYGEHPITRESAGNLGRAMATFLARGKKCPKVMIARDTRGSWKDLEPALAKGAADAGASVKLLGALPGNAVSFYVRNEKAQGGIMISASHNPAEENGFKFFNSAGFKFSEAQEREIEGILASESFGSSPGNIARTGSAAYLGFLRKSLHGDLKGLKIAVDAGNGAASGIAGEIFGSLKAEAKIINCEPDGTNINEGCGAVSPQELQRVVREDRLDAGAAFDGDADRLAMADENGSLIPGDALIAAAAAWLKKKGRLKGSAVAVNDYSNGALEPFLEARGIRVSRVRTGDKFVSAELSEKNYSFGGESSGHIIFFDLARTSDAVLSAIQILGMMKQDGVKLSELAGGMKLLPQAAVNVEVREKREIRLMDGVAGAVQEAEAELGSEGRVFIRYSGTESLMRILVEGKSESKIKRHADKIAGEARQAIGK